MRHFTSLAVTAALAVTLSACQSSNQGNTQIASIAPQQSTENRAVSAFNGQWKPPADDANAGVYTAEFKNGSFLSRAVENGNVLAKGSYEAVSDSQVNLDFVGAATKAKVKATCTKVSADRMSCTPTVGGTFILVRS